MDRMKDFNDILERCLERVLGGEPVEACLADYTAYAAELEPMLRTALEARDAAGIQPRPEFRQRAALEFQAAIREMPAKAPGVSIWHRRWMGAVAGVVFVLLAGTGLVAASNGSLPGQPLYAVKTATEAVWLAFTPSDIGKAELYVKFTDRRVREIIAMADRGDTEQMDRATARMDGQMVAMANLTAPVDAAYQSIVTSTESEPMLATAPGTTTVTTTQPGVTMTPTRTKPMTTTASIPTGPAPDEPPTTPAPPVTVSQPETTIVLNSPIKTLPDEGQAREDDAILGASPEDLDEEARLRELLLRSATSNSRALLEELENAPESVRAALLKAIEVAGAGYASNLSNLERQ